MALCISAQSTCIWPRSRLESEKLLGTSTSVRVSAGRWSRLGQEVRGRSRAAPQAGEVGVGPGAADPQEMPAGARLGGNLVAEGVVLRAVAVDQAEVEQAADRQRVAGREIEVVHHELGEVGRAGWDVRLCAGAAGAADLVGDLLQRRATGAGVGIADRGEEIPRLGFAEEVARRSGLKGHVACFCLSCVR